MVRHLKIPSGAPTGGVGQGREPKQRHLTGRALNCPNEACLRLGAVPGARSEGMLSPQGGARLHPACLRAGGSGPGLEVSRC